ncbi:hypothetical protein [Nocardia callitridis]|uniref:Uncharacterized protein n=1 Tax=Nocardia callitridis TaxID=648753 RepID=A0ABP9KTQ6_9NOCA
MHTAILRTAVATAFLSLAFGAAAFGAGTATAAVPVADVDHGRVGLRLDHGETTSVASGPIPALVTMVVPLNKIGAGLHEDTAIVRDEQGGVHASLRDVVLEAADHPDGTVTVYLDAPGARNGRVLDIYQNWN